MNPTISPHTSPAAVVALAVASPADTEALRHTLCAAARASGPALRTIAALRTRLCALENAHGYLDALVMDAQMLGRNPAPSVQMRARIRSNLANLDIHLAALTALAPADAQAFAPVRAALGVTLGALGILGVYGDRAALDAGTLEDARAG